MTTVSDADLLDLWEWGIYHNPIERSLALVAIVSPDRSLEELARQPVGVRNLCLVRLREALFGPELELQTSCPECIEPLEIKIPITSLANAVDSGKNIQTSAETAGHENPDLAAYQTLEANGQTIRFRLPNSLDLLEAAASSQPRLLMLERCMTQVEPNGFMTPPPAPLIPEMEALLAARMQVLDPLANISFALTCPACAHAWTAPFDIANCLWNEIDTWAHRTLREIHWLASIYHWSETNILALGPLRRQVYLQMSGYA